MLCHRFRRAPGPEFFITPPRGPQGRPKKSAARGCRQRYMRGLGHAKALLPEKLVLDTARETVALFHQYWQSEKANLPLSADVVQAIEGHLKTIPIA